MIIPRERSSLERGASFAKFKKVDVNPLSGLTKVRTLYAPNQEMKHLHQLFTKRLRKLVETGAVDLSSATAVVGGSPRKNVEYHRNSRHFYLTDITNAFPSVDIARLARLLYMLDQHAPLERVEEFLREFCEGDDGGLIIGSPSSNDLFNIYASMLLDFPMQTYCDMSGITYTRYLDDLTFSSSVVIGSKKRRNIRKIIESSGLRIGHHKSKVLDLKKQPIEINGVGLEYGGRIFLPRWYVRKIRGLLRVYETGRSEKLLKKIHGMMGLFRAVTTHRDLNRIEQKLLHEYECMCQWGTFIKPRPKIVPPADHVPWTESYYERRRLIGGLPLLDHDDDLPF